MENTPKQSTFKRNAHIAYFRRCLQALPASATGQDANRITLAYFCLSGLDLLDAITSKLTEKDKSGWADWIWTLQHPSGGFRGSTFMTTSNPDTSPPHLPSTYTALLCLAILRAPLDRLNVPGLSTFLESCQGEDGSFSPLPRKDIEGDFQSDLRMSYCASVVSNIIGQESFDRELAHRMIQSCQTWEGGYASRPHMIESQGGTTYCAIASMSLLSGSSSTTSISASPFAAETANTTRWLLQRQIGGFQGRPGKLEDVCYSFWCGAALAILGHPDLVNSQEDRAFLLSSQSPMGGFGKEPEEFPDPYHSYLALAALALHEQKVPELELKALDATWNVSVETAEWLRSEIKRIRGK